MLIQPLVQSSSSSALFANSVSASGVEQAVVRAPIPPVQEPANSANANNGLQNFQTPSSSVSPQQEPPAAANDSKGSSAQGTSGSDFRSVAQAKTDQQKSQQEADKVVIDQLKARDQQVRLHEAAHASVGGQFAGSPSYQYQRGPDGKDYAVGGEVSISTSPVKGDPQATIAKARIIRAAALAPAEPSSQDQAVAAAAAQMALRAEFELQQQQTQASQQKVADEQAKEVASRDAAINKIEKQDAARQAEQKTANQDVAAQAAAQKEQAKKEAAKSGNDNTGQTGNNTQGSSASGQSTAAGNNNAASQSTAADQARKQSNALQQLQQILLGPGNILVQASQKGLVNPQHPFGNSGLLNVFA